MMTAARTALIADLLATLFQDNKTLLLELKIDNVISGCKRENPVLEPLIVDENLYVNADNLPDSPEVMTALGSMAFTIGEYLEVFVGAEESNRRLAQAVRLFRAKYMESEIAGIVETLPEVFALGAQGADSDLENLGELEKVKRIFLQIYAMAIRENPELAGNLAAQLRVCGILESVSDDAAWFDFVPGTDLGTAVDRLSAATEDMGISPTLVEDAIAGYGGLPSELGILERLFNGVLSGVTNFGIAPIDSLLRDGIRCDSTLILKGPAGVEKEILATAFLRGGLERGGSAIVVSSRCSPACIRQGLESSGLEMENVDAGERLIFVDWYSRYTRRVTSIEEEPGLIRVSNDLTNLAVGIDLALGRMKNRPRKRMVIDMVSPTIVTEGFDRVHEFLNSVRAKLKNAECTGLVLINPGMHSGDQVGILDDVFDGTLTIERKIDRGRMKSTFMVAGLSGGAYSTARLDMEITARGLSISGGEQGSQLITFDNDEVRLSLGLPGIESVTGGGLPVGRNFLVWISTTMMPADYIKPMIIEAQKEGNAILLALSSIGPDLVGEWMSEQGLSLKGLIDRGLLQMVDWQGRKGHKVLGMEIDRGIIRTSKDITHLGVGLDYAFRQINDQVTSMAVLEIISPALRLFDLQTVYPFARSMHAKLAHGGFTSFILMERDAHDPHVNAALEEIFDGIIDIRSVGDSLEIGVLGIRGCHFQPEYRTLNRLRDRLTVDVARNISQEEIVDSIRNQGMAGQLAQMESELARALSEKQRLENRMRELEEREAQYEMRHSEMKANLASIEERLKQQMARIPEHAAHDPEHGKELARILAIMDAMLEDLPEDVIQRFAKSDDFKLYEKIMNAYLEESDD